MKQVQIECLKHLKIFILIKPEIIINLQGDMPNLDPKAIIKLNEYLQKSLCDISYFSIILKTKMKLK